MKTLIVFGAGVALGCFLKKPKIQSQPKFMLVGDHASLSDSLLKPENLNKLREHLKNRAIRIN
jgi:hypothetical protein